MGSLALALPRLPPQSPRALSRAVEAEAAVARLKGELRSSKAESKRKLDDAHLQLAECRGRLVRGSMDSASGGERGLPSLAGGLASINDKMSAMEGEVERQRLELEVSTCKSELEGSARRLGRQERIVSKLMAELREEKMRSAARHTSHAVIEKLRVELAGKVGTASSRVVGMQEVISRDLAAAAERLAASALTDEARGADMVSELQACAASARLSELAAVEARERSETRLAALQRRVSVQARLVTQLLTERQGMPEAEAEAEAERLTHAEEATEEAEEQEEQEDDDVRFDELVPASPSSAGRLMGALKGGVMRVASAARDYVNSPSDASGAGTVRDRAAAANMPELQYTWVLEEELGGALHSLAKQNSRVEELGAELEAARASSSLCTSSSPLSSVPRSDEERAASEEAEAQAAALAAAEAAADALFESDGCASDPLEAERPEMQSRAATAALLDELRLESLKSTRLEKIISKLMTELRAAKLQAASAGCGKAALTSFESISSRLEAQLRDNATAVGVVEVTLRKGLETVAERLAAVSAADKTASAGR